MQMHVPSWRSIIVLLRGPSITLIVLLTTVTANCRYFSRTTFTHIQLTYDTIIPLNMNTLSGPLFSASCLILQLILLHLTNFFSRITWVSRHQKGKPFWILLEQEMMGWQWHQLDHMRIICTSLQTDNHASTSPLSVYRPDALPATQPTASKH